MLCFVELYGLSRVIDSNMLECRRSIGLHDGTTMHNQLKRKERG
jgi:hypothetical protein